MPCKQWIFQVIRKPILDVIFTHDTHWFFFCCGTLVNAPSSLYRVVSFANEWGFFFSFHFSVCADSSWQLEANQFVCLQCSCLSPHICNHLFAQLLPAYHY